MAKTLVNIRDYVRDVLDEQSASDWTNAEIDVWINVRYHQVYTAIINTFEDYYSTTTQANTVADQQEYSLPSDFYKLRRVEINYDTSQTSNAPQRALPINIDSVRRDLGQTNLGVIIQHNPIYYIRGNTIGFIPIPDKGQTNAIKYWYVKTVSDMSADSDAPDIPYVDRYWVAIAMGAVADLLRFGQQDMTSADRFDLKFEVLVSKMQEELEDRIADESKFITDVMSESFDFIGSEY